MNVPPRERAAAAAAADTPAEVLDRLADDTSRDVRLAVATNPSTGKETLLRLLRSRSGVVAARAAIHPALSWDDVAWLADRNGFSSVGALMHPEIPVAVQADVAERLHPHREVLADTPWTAPEVLRTLAVDPDPSVRAAVAENEGAPDDARAAAALSL